MAGVHAPIPHEQPSTSQRSSLKAKQRSSSSYSREPRHGTDAVACNCVSRVLIMGGHFHLTRPALASMLQSNVVLIPPLITCHDLPNHNSSGGCRVNAE
jgi:hypothetical protein